MLVPEKTFSVSSKAMSDESRVHGGKESTILPESVNRAIKTGRKRRRCRTRGWINRKKERCGVAKAAI